jgi:DNA repair exonuclease SbcCD nuclease subunit
MFRFIHAADIHLDSPLQGLERYEDAPVDEVRAAPREALSNLVQLAIDLDVAFVLLAGDLYDGDWKDYNTGIFFVGQMRRLQEADIPVHIVSGNHDAASQITRRLSMPPNVTHYSSRRPQTSLLEEYSVAIHGQSFANRSISDDLSAGYPQGEPGRFDVGLLHTSLDGRPGHADYSPCSIEGLASKGYQYWALGHVHRREEVSQRPWIVFPGNLQGRHARETGAKGCSVVCVEDGEVVSVDHHVLDVVRWERVEVDLSEARTAQESVDHAAHALGSAMSAAGGRLLAARLVLCGASAAHAELVSHPDRWQHEFRIAANGLGQPGVWLEKIVIETRPLRDLASELDRADALGELLRLVSDLERAPLELEELGAAFADLKKKLPPPLQTGDEVIDPTDPSTLREMLPAVRDLLLARLLDLEEAP